jgi:hypothetical protein
MPLHMPSLGLKIGQSLCNFYFLFCVGSGLSLFLFCHQNTPKQGFENTNAFLNFSDNATVSRNRPGFHGRWPVTEHMLKQRPPTYRWYKGENHL